MLKKSKSSATGSSKSSPVRPNRRSVGLAARVSFDGKSGISNSPIAQRKISAEKRKTSRVHLGRLHFLPDQEEEVEPTEPVSQHDFFMAASSGRIKAVRKYLDDGGDVNSVDSCGRTALHRASLYEQPAIMNLLIERGAKVNAVDKLQNTPLHWACRGNNLEVIQTLMSNKAKVNKKDQLQNAPLHVATRVGFTEGVDYLLECGAKINEKDSEGDTPIHDAIRLGRPKVVKTLVLHGANMTVKNKDGKTAEDMIQAWFNNTKDAIMHAEGARQKKGIDKEKLLFELQKTDSFPNSRCIQSIEEIDEEEELEANKECDRKNVEDLKREVFSSKDKTSVSLQTCNNEASRETIEAKTTDSLPCSVTPCPSTELTLTQEEQLALTNMEKAFPSNHENLMKSHVLSVSRTKSESDIVN